MVRLMKISPINGISITIHPDFGVGNTSSVSLKWTYYIQYSEFSREHFILPVQIKTKAILTSCQVNQGPQNDNAIIHKIFSTLLYKKNLYKIEPSPGFNMNKRVHLTF